MGKSRFAGSYDSSVFIFLTTSIVFSMEWKLEWLHQFTLHQWCKSVPLSSHPFPDHCSPHSLQSSVVSRLEWSVCSAQVGHILNQSWGRGQTLEQYSTHLSPPPWKQANPCAPREWNPGFLLPSLQSQQPSLHSLCWTPGLGHPGCGLNLSFPRETSNHVISSFP